MKAGKAPETALPTGRDREPPGGEKLTMTIPQAAALLGLSRNAAYEAAGRGELPCLKIGRRLVVPRAALLRLLDSVDAEKKVG